MHLYPPNYSHVSMNTLKLDQAFSIYKGEFAKTADFTFVIVGSFNKAEMLQLLAQFIGSLPASNPSKVHIPEKGPVEYQGDIKQKEFKSSNRLTLVRDYSGNINVRILFRARAIENTRNELIMEVTNRIIQSLLFKRLREQDKGVYGVLTNLRKGGQSEEFFLDVDFETAPFDVNRMIAAVENELQQLSLATPDEGLFLNALASVKNATQQRMNSHVFWYTYLLESAKKDQFNPENLKRIEILETIKPVDITNIMCNSFNLEPYRIFELL
ncbi:MAG: insulinase family protein [Chryseobacterium sp.]|nr:MAG: insulinase family protein [Chryseobacterium sp.]